MAVGSLSRPAGRERVGERVGPKMKTDTFLSTAATQFDATDEGADPDKNKSTIKTI